MVKKLRIIRNTPNILFKHCKSDIQYIKINEYNLNIITIYD